MASCFHRELGKLYWHIRGVEGGADQPAELVGLEDVGVDPVVASAIEMEAVLGSVVAVAAELTVVHRGGNLVALQLAHPARAEPHLLAYLW